MFATVAMATSAFAQEFRVGATAGMEFSKISFLEDGVYEDNSDVMKSKAGIKIGVIGECSFNDYIALAPELAFVQRGYKWESGDSDEWTKLKININYLQIPINVKGIYPISDDFKIFGFTGYYVGFALSGKRSWKHQYKGEKETDSEKLKFGSKGSNENASSDEDYFGDDYKRLDFGLNFGVGAEFKGFFLKTQYNLGLKNLIPVPEIGERETNRNFGISVGYMFSF